MALLCNGLSQLEISVDRLFTENVESVTTLLGTNPEYDAMVAIFTVGRSCASWNPRSCGSKMVHERVSGISIVTQTLRGIIEGQACEDLR
jgi:hypothetical protein